MELGNNYAIEKLRSGEIIFAHKNVEGMSSKGKEALVIIQRGLILLELMPPIPENEYGMYGDKTSKAVNYLQNRAKIDSIQGWDGRKIDAATLNALEKALREKIEGRWLPPEIY